MKFFKAGIVLFLGASYSCETGDNNVKIEVKYPENRKMEISDNYFGKEIKDPYRWLENDTSSETAAWVNSQNAVTFGYLKQIPFRDKIRKRLDELLNYPRQSAPIRAGVYYFYTKNNGLQNQDVIMLKKGLKGEERIFIDPNTYSEEGTTTFSIAGFSDDNRHVVFSRSDAGSDWSEMVVYDIESGNSTGDTLRWVKFSGVSWFNNGFFYSRYPEPLDGSDYSASNTMHSVYFHRMGDSQSNDELIFKDENHPNRYHWTSVTEDKSYLILYIAEGTDGFECYFRSLNSDNKSFSPLFTGFDHKNSIIDHYKGRFLVRTDIDAANYRLVSVDPYHPEPENWMEVVAENEHLLEGVSIAGGYLFVNYLQNAQSKVFRMSYDGKNRTEILLPAAGSAGGFDGKKEDSLVFFTFSSFTYPGSIFTYHIKSGKSALYFQPELSFRSEDYISTQEFYTSKDGTKVSMFIIHKKGLEKNGKNPCLLYGYGGFNISLTPGFSSTRLPWLENGGIVAIPNLRGGGEYGEKWHQAGMLFNKQNVFDDFIAAAEYLISSKYTSSAKLVISGRSNGGLLVGAVMAQRPDLFQVALPGVGVMDMLRYQKFTVGHGWVPEYGSSDEEDHFNNLIKYSPLHNLKPNTDYPATLVYTADHDDRVVPAHSFKFAATLQEMNSGKNPVLIRIDVQAGHGSGKPISKMLDEEADKMAFSFYNVGHEVYPEH